MRKTLSFMLISFILGAAPAFADTNLEPLLNKVFVPFQAEQWVTTKSALVNVNVNASVSDQGIEKIQNDVLEKLKLLSNAGEWHIMSFERQEDRSGLENIMITAQARLPQGELGNLRGKAKSLSKPGVTFTIDRVQFTPSDVEIQQANILLRNNLYQQVKAEIDALNKAYPDQKFYVHQINVSESPMMPVPMANEMAFGASAKMVAQRSDAGSVPLSVGNKQRLYANVVIAAMPDVLSQHIAHQS